MKRRVESTTSQTAKMTCLSRACSALETDPHYKSGDYVAPSLLPRGWASLLHLRLGRMLFSRVVAPRGMYEYVIARTKYIDAVFERSLAEAFPQVLIFGAGFDTRMLRFQDLSTRTRIFELDMAPTQTAKLGQYQARHLAVPTNGTFATIDFEKQLLPRVLDEAGFRRQQRSLFVLEGLLMYLRPKAVQATFQTIQAFAGERSWIVFDCVYASVIRHEGTRYGETGIVKTVTGAGEQWNFGIEAGGIQQFLAPFDLTLIEQRDARDLERAYFTDPLGKLIARVNDTHCLFLAEKC
jgi:methyltransferase (TIGR00027 family)